MSLLATSLLTPYFFSPYYLFLLSFLLSTVPLTPYYFPPSYLIS